MIKKNNIRNNHSVPPEDPSNLRYINSNISRIMAIIIYAFYAFIIAISLILCLLSIVYRSSRFIYLIGYINFAVLCWCASIYIAYIICKYKCSYAILPKANISYYLLTASSFLIALTDFVVIRYYYENKYLYYVVPTVGIYILVSIAMILLKGK